VVKKQRNVEVKKQHSVKAKRRQSVETKRRRSVEAKKQQSVALVGNKVVLEEPVHKNSRISKKKRGNNVLYNRIVKKKNTPILVPLQGSIVVNDVVKNKANKKKYNNKKN
jgi:hypothetical protein